MNFMVSVFSGIVASILFKWLEFIFRNKAVDNKSSQCVSEQYIGSIIKQFYFCFPTGIAVVIWRFFTPSESFLASAQIVIATLMLMLSLFAFSCSIEVIDTLKNRNPDNEPGNSD